MQFHTMLWREQSAACPTPDRTLTVDVLAHASARPPADGEAAIEMASRLTPHIIIMDVKMPRMGGLEATRRIKLAPDVHVIGISAQADTFLKASMKAVGSSTFVTKDCAHTLPDVIAQITGRPIDEGVPF